MRVTNAMLLSQAMYDLNGLRQKYAKAQSAVNGRALERPSDDVQRVVEAMDLSGAKLRLERSQVAGQDAREWMSVVENGLTTMIETLQNAREVAVQGGSPSSRDPDAHQALAKAVLMMRDSLLQQMNGRHRDQYLFGGWRTDAIPFELEDGGANYVANNSGSLMRDIAPGLSVAINIPGDQLLAQGDMIKTLTDLADDLMNGRTDEVVGDRLKEIDQALGHLTILRSDLGVRQQQVAQYESYALDTLLQIADRMTDITGTDLETAVLQMTEAQTAYQAALASFAKALPTSLLDYMLR